MKTCRRCGETKPPDQLKRDARNGDGYSSFCKKCHSAATRAWQAANPDKLNAARRARYARKKDGINAKRKASYSYDKVRWERLRQLYCVTQEWYEATLRRQGFACAICKREQGLFKRAFAVDHRHGCCPKAPTCGSCNRGLLCHPCNTAMHSLERDGTWIKKAMEYLHG